MTIDSLDLLLHLLYKDRDLTQFNDIHEQFNKIQEVSVFDLLAMLQELTDKGYVIKKPATQEKRTLNTGELLNTKQTALFYISFRGILFFEKPPLPLKNR